MLIECLGLSQYEMIDKKEHGSITLIYQWLEYIDNFV